MVLLVSYDDIELQSSNDVQFALNAGTTLEPHET